MLTVVEFDMYYWPSWKQFERSGSIKFRPLTPHYYDWQSLQEQVGVASLVVTREPHPRLYFSAPQSTL